MNSWLTYRRIIANQQITADFSGRIEAVQGEVGQQVQGGAVLANLIDDSVMTATLYFSYQYQDMISKGMEVSVSVPDQQLSLTGTVSDIQYVDYHTPEGMQCFGVTVQVYRTTASETIFYDATLTYLSLEATSNTSGVSTFEATITIDSKGELSSGVTVYYSIDTSGEGDTGESVLAPVDALCTYDDGYYLLVQADQQPEGTIDPTQVGGSVTEYPEGYYAVPVEVGDYNGNNIQILSGVSEDTTVFLRYQNARPTGGDTTSEGGSQSEEQTGRPSGEMPSGEMMQIPAFGNMGAGGTGGMGTGAMGGGMPSGRG